MRTHSEAKDDQIPTMKRLNSVLVAKQKLLEPLLVTKIKVTTKAMCLLHFVSHRDFVTQGYLPAKGIFESNPNRSFFVLVTNITTKQQPFYENKVLRNFYDSVFTIGSAKVPQKASQDGQLLPSVKETISTEEESSSSTSQIQEQLNWCKSIVIFEKY